MEIKEIKQRLSILSVLNHYNLYPDRNNMLKCPFHADDVASLKIYPDTNTFNCFGCGKNGDQIEFCAFKEGGKHKGLLKATELSGEINPVCNGPKQTTNQPKENHSDVPTADLSKVETLTRFFAYFRNNLNHPVAVKPKEYLRARNLNHELLETGYNSGQFHHRGKLDGAETQACVEAGLLVPYKGSVPNATGTTYTAFAKDCIVFPLKNNQNQIVGLYGRGIQENKRGSGKHFYLKNRTGLYPGYPKPETTKLILTEAIIDAATLLQIKEITAEHEILSCYGTNGLTEEHLEAIKEWATCPELVEGKEMIFFFDGDKAGTEAIRKYHQELNELLPKVKLSAVDTPQGEDINSLAMAHEPEIFTHLLENRKLFLLTEEALTEEALTENPSIKKETLPEPDQEAAKAILNTRNPDYITYTTEDLQVIILGGINLQQLDRLRTTIKISRTDTKDPLHSIRHTLDLYHSDYLEKFINKASEQLEIGTNLIKRALAELTEQIEAYRLSKAESQKGQRPKARQLTESRARRAINYLSSKNLMERTNGDIGKTGMIGEENNRLLMYLVFTSRLREQPLHIISLGSSGTGKTYLQEKISELIPEQDKLEITILSENAFYYFDRKELKNKLVLIEDMDGAENVLYPLRELQSKMKISKTVPIKDAKGNLKTITLHVEGPICLAGTTTRERLYEDNSNRSLLIYLDNAQDHKEKIMEYQRRLSAGKIDARGENELKEFFKDMQSVLKPIRVRNPYAEYLKLPEYIFKPLRTNSHYLAVIETITFYHQYQREVKTDPGSGERYIETNLGDIEWANRLLKDVLLAKSDELPRAVREFFERLKAFMKASGQEVFYAKEIRETFRMASSSCNRYILELLRNNYIKITGGNKYRQGFEYQIIKPNEYRKLQDHVKTALDEALENIRKSVSRIPEVSQNQNGILKPNNASKLTTVSQ
jgi:DNA primase catalytic core